MDEAGVSPKHLAVLYRMNKRMVKTRQLAELLAALSRDELHKAAADLAQRELEDARDARTVIEAIKLLPVDMRRSRELVVALAKAMELSSPVSRTVH